MSYNVVLNSANVVPGTGNSQYKIDFKPGGFVFPDKSTLSISQATIPYSWYNVTAKLGNNTFQYLMPTTGSTITTNTIVLPDGFYTLDDLNSYLYKDLESKSYYFYNLDGGAVGLSNPSVIYPIKFSAVPSSYTNSVTLQWIPTSAPNVVTAYGTGWLWALGTFPTALATAQFVVTGSVTPTSTLFGNLIGFIEGTYPSALTTTLTIYNLDPVVILGNTLKINSITNPAWTGSVAPVPFAPNASPVNSLVVRCNIIDNDIIMPTDILDTIPIDSSFGSNITYKPAIEKNVKIRSGKASSLVITFSDQNYNAITILDNNLSLTLLIRL